MNSSASLGPPYGISLDLIVLPFCRSLVGVFLLTGGGRGGFIFFFPFFEYISRDKDGTTAVFSVSSKHGFLLCDHGGWIF